MANALGDTVDPHQAVHDHLQQVYGGGQQKVGDFPYKAEEVQRVPDFSVEELREGLRKGNRRVAVGADKISHELLIKIANSEEGENKILRWFNRLHGDEPLPQDWNTATMILIPKVTHPEEPKHVRPICIGSFTSKLYCRLLLARTQEALRYSSSSQSMGAGRQTADYVFCVARMMQLEQEWRCGTCFLKVDVEKAFDSLNRRVFLQRLATKMGCSEVLCNWWSMFQDAQAVLTTVWGESVVDMVTGIRQGSVESPQMFAAVIDWVLSDLRWDHGWDHQQVFEGLVAFVDDLIHCVGGLQTGSHYHGGPTRSRSSVLGPQGEPAQEPGLR